MSIAERFVPEVENFVKSGMNISLGIPLHGDVFFMPDWTRKIGKKIKYIGDNTCRDFYLEIYIAH